MHGLRRALPTGLEPFYARIQAAVQNKSIHPLRASKMIVTAIENGHTPPEILPTSRRSLQSLVTRYIRRDMNKEALAEINRCLERGYVDEFTLLAPIADDYLNCLITMQDPQPHLRSPANDRLGIRSEQLIVAARFIAKLDHHGQAREVAPKTYCRLISKMAVCKHNCNPQQIITIALKNHVQLDTASWNLRLSSVASKQASKVLENFKVMTDSDVKPDKNTFSLVLQSLRRDNNFHEEAEKVIHIARQLDLYNEYIATEEMSLCKAQGRYQDLLHIFTLAFGSEFLDRCGFVTLHTTMKTTSTKLLHLNRVSMSLVIDALVRINPSVENVTHLYDTYQSFVRDRTELSDDIYAPSIFIRAFAQHPTTLVKAIEILESMRSPVAEGSGGSKTNRANVVSYTTLIDGLVKHEMMDLAVKMLQYMKADGIEPDVYTWRALHRGYVRSGYIEEALAAQRMIDRLERNPGMPAKRKKGHNA